MHATLPLLKSTDFPEIARGTIQTLQVNLGYRCNQACLHCHVNAEPRPQGDDDARGRSTRCSRCCVHAASAALDLTGGAPEMNPHFR